MTGDRETCDGKAQTTSLQLTLWETPDDGQGRARDTNAVGIYDQAPRFVFFGTKKSRDNGAKRKAGEQAASAQPVVVMPSTRSRRMIKRDFDFGGATYGVTIRPVLIERRGSDGEMTELEVYPGEREQIVEEVIRRIATERARLRLSKEDRIQMDFSLYEVLEELRRVGHGLNLQELKEALTILHLASIQIKAVGAGGEELLHSSAFPVMALASRAGAEGERQVERTYLEFNPLVAKAIRQLQFHRLDYECLMRIDNPASRWLYKRLAWGIQNGEENLSISATQIVRNSGMTPWSRLRAMLSWITKACEALIEKGILASVERDIVKNGAAYVDINYVLIPSEHFLGQMRTARALAQHDAAEVKRITGSTKAPDQFVRIDHETAVTTRRKRRKVLIAETEAVLPLCAE